MRDFADSFANAKEHLRPVDWSQARSENVRARIEQRRRRFTLSTVALGSAVLAVAVAVAIVVFAQQGASKHKAVAAEGQIELRDGTRAVALDGSSDLRLVHEDETQVSFAMESGKGWFEVTPSATRRVEVTIKDVRVQVMGTEFVVEVQGEFVHVWVHRGKVEVTSDAGTVFLEKGEHGKFLSHENRTDEARGPADAGVADQADAYVPAEEPKDEPAPPMHIREVPADVPPLPQLAPKPVPPMDAVSVLWRHADEARSRGQHKKAIAALTELINIHGDDPRSALAAFSLGRVLVDANESPKTAARAFAKARKLSPEGPLVEDALLREIEAWHDARDTRRVEKRAAKYLRLFPHGRYRNQINEMRETP